MIDGRRAQPRRGLSPEPVEVRSELLIQATLHFEPALPPSACLAHLRRALALLGEELRTEIVASPADARALARVSAGQSVLGRIFSFPEIFPPRGLRAWVSRGGRGSRLSTLGFDAWLVDPPARRAAFQSFCATLARAVLATSPTAAAIRRTEGGLAEWDLHHHGILPASITPWWFASGAYVPRATRAWLKALPVAHSAPLGRGWCLQVDADLDAAPTPELLRALGAAPVPAGVIAFNP